MILKTVRIQRNTCIAEHMTMQYACHEHIWIYECKECEQRERASEIVSENKLFVRNKLIIIIPWIFAHHAKISQNDTSSSIFISVISNEYVLFMCRMRAGYIA